MPRTFAIATGLGAIIASCIAGGGMCTLARMFQALAERKPYLDAGVYGYARRFWRLSGVPSGPSSLRLHTTRDGEGLIGGRVGDECI